MSRALVCRWGLEHSGENLSKREKDTDSRHSFVDAFLKLLFMVFQLAVLIIAFGLLQLADQPLGV